MMNPSPATPTQRATPKRACDPNPNRFFRLLSSLTPNSPAMSCGGGGGGSIGGVSMPALSGDFLAMSVFFYAMHCLHALGPAELAAWPRPTLSELRDAARGFCGMEWGALQDRKVRNRCFFLLLLCFWLISSGVLRCVCLHARGSYACGPFLKAFAVCSQHNSARWSWGPALRDRKVRCK